MRRRLTISSLWVGQRSEYQASFCPFLRLSGRWLEKAGFRIGQSVFVQVENGKLTIMPMEETEANQVEAGLPAERSRKNVTA